jgi:hypothetical protein
VVCGMWYKAAALHEACPYMYYSSELTHYNEY